MRIAITGASGFVGQALARHLHGSGHRIVAVGRDIARFQSWSWIESCVPFELGSAVEETALAGVDAVLHLAHDFRPGRADVNVRGAGILVAAARRAGVGQFIFFSSYSAHGAAVSEYGRTKLRIEETCRGQGGTIVRPGLVIGAGGLFGRLSNVVARLAVIPVPGTRQATVPIVSSDDLCLAVERVLTLPLRGDFNLFYRDLPPFLTLLKEIAQAMRRRRAFVPIPIGPIVLGMRIAESLGVPLPVSSDNLLGYLANQGSPHASDLDRILSTQDTLAMAVRKAVHPRKQEP